MTLVRRTEILCPAVARVLHGLRDRLHLVPRSLNEELEEDRVELGDQRDIEPIEPEHRLVGLVAVIVPRPVGRGHVVPPLHERALAAHSRVGALALDDEAGRGGRVVMRARDLARKDELDAGVERSDGADLLRRQAGVEEVQNATLRLLRGHQLSRAHHARPHLRPLPEVRDASGPRFRRERVVEDVPERAELVLRQVGIELLALCLELRGDFARSLRSRDRALFRR